MKRRSGKTPKVICAMNSTQNTYINKPNRVINTVFICFFRHIALFMIIISFALLINLTGAFGSDNYQPKYENNDEISFTLTKFSPYLTNDTPANIAISTNSSNIEQVKVSFLKPTNTRSELFGFTDSPTIKGTISSISIPITNFSNTTLNTLKSYESSFAINSSDPTIPFSITLNKTGIYPVAIELLDSENKSLSTRYSFVTYFSGINYATQAYSEKLNIVPILTSSENYMEEKIFTTD